MQWFYDLKTGQKIIGLVILMALFIGTVGAIGYYYLKQGAEDTANLYNDKLMPVAWLNDARSHMRANEANLLWVIVSQNPTIKEEHHKDIKTRADIINEDLANYGKVDLDSFEKDTLNKLNKNLAEYREIRTKILEAADVGKTQEALKMLNEGKEAFNAANDEFVELAEYLEKEAKAMDEQNDRESAFAQSAIMVTIVIALILAVIIGLLIAKMIADPLVAMLKNVEEVASGNLAVDEINVKSTDEVGKLGSAFNVMTKNLRNLVTQVMRSVEEISSGSEEMSAAAEQTAQGAQQTATSVQQLAAGSQEQARSITDSLENINKMGKAIQLISENSNSTVKISKDTEDNATSGKGQAEKAVEKINQIKVTSLGTSETVKELGKLSSEIELIVDLIKNIAGQTNLLALNAAIEAARAGEHGKGFAVVADEVKKLAAQSAEATDKITGMIKDIQGKTNEAVIAMDEGVQEVEEGVTTIENVGKALEAILTAAKETSNNINEISSEVNTLAKNSDSVVKAMENVSSITEESAASSEEIASISEEQTASIEEISASSQSLAKIAENLQKQVAVFKV